MSKQKVEKFKNMSQGREMDCTNADEGLWLVKVPKYISSKWEKIASGSEGGRLKITTGADGKPEMTCVLTDSPATASNKRESDSIPMEHKFIISNVSNQSLAIYSETLGESHKSAVSNNTGPNKLVLEGHVTNKCEMRPVADKKYMMLKKQSIMLAQEPERKAMHLKKAVNTFKPVNTHKHIIEAKQKQKLEGKKTRDDEDKVQERLFAAFEEHQYYNIKDLEKITKQPMPYLKKILKGICNYNVKNPHRNMWELKPEYRCYKDSEEKQAD